MGLQQRFYLARSLGRVLPCRRQLTSTLRASLSRNCRKRLNFGIHLATPPLGLRAFPLNQGKSLSQVHPLYVEISPKLTWGPGPEDATLVDDVSAVRN